MGANLRLEAFGFSLPVLGFGVEDLGFMRVGVLESKEFRIMGFRV